MRGSGSGLETKLLFNMDVKSLSNVIANDGELSALKHCLPRVSENGVKKIAGNLRKAVVKIIKLIGCL